MPLGSTECFLTNEGGASQTPTGNLLHDTTSLYDRLPLGPSSAPPNRVVSSIRSASETRSRNAWSLVRLGATTPPNTFTSAQWSQVNAPPGQPDRPLLNRAEDCDRSPCRAGANKDKSA